MIIELGWTMAGYEGARCTVLLALSTVSYVYICLDSFGFQVR